jgi:hypothetical protein
VGFLRTFLLLISIQTQVVLASEVCPDPTNVHGIFNIIGTGQILTVETQKYVFEEMVSPCMSAAWNGASDSVKSTIENAPSFLGKAWNTISDLVCAAVFIRRPGEMKCVQRVGQSIANTIDLVRSLRGALSDAIEGFQDMDPKVQAELACSFTGQMGLEGVLAYVTVGALRSKFAASIGSFFSRIKKLGKFLHKDGGLSAEEQLLMARNLSKYSDEQVELINFFRRAGEPNLARGLIQCAL